MDKLIPRNLIKHRKAKKLSQEEVAGLLGISQASYWRYESGRAKVSIDVLSRLAKIYEISPWNLVDSSGFSSCSLEELRCENQSLKEDLEKNRSYIKVLEQRLMDKEEIIFLLREKSKLSLHGMEVLSQL